ncbi:scavenger mRNA decapping enzyme [Vararia minispora EC-137]|uniref:Scavenger mRNA decapping enzyme n=1 Tax=Vararia minispora EC-137 TaxID=1314806 RepID=A0ACB8QJG7_9AGAM|nr:scavenger mRNA decapping enzyme [Vararia minispora EC-137]
MAPQFNLHDFELERVLNDDPQTHSVTLLGRQRIASETQQDPGPQAAIVRIEKTALPKFSDGLVVKTQVIESTDIYTWLFGWLQPSDSSPDLKINAIYPATETHIRKYSKQSVHIVRETPELYESIVKPYIEAFPSSRTQWVTDILTGTSEAEKVLFRSPPSSPDGFLILPDMKWDTVTLGSLYLVALALSSEVKCLRDVKKRHLPMLKAIRRETRRIVEERFGLESTQLRLFVHYQPSYYHFHVHIVNANYLGLQNMAAGQAHLLDDIISLLEVDSSPEGVIFQRMTLTYSLGENHGLFAPMMAAQAGLEDSEAGARPTAVA